MTLIVLNVIILLMIISIALFFKYNIPKEINDFIGYRTTRSMRSQEAWDLANSYSANMIFRYSLFVSILQIILYFIFGGLIALLAVCATWVFTLLFTMVKTEAELKKNGF
jgi:uncharacterized membrane protein